jgi:hypothetical protein
MSGLWMEIGRRARLPGVRSDRRKKKEEKKEKKSKSQSN